MSFFDDNQKVGLALMIIGIIGLIVAVAAIANAFGDNTDTGAAIAGGIGGLIFGFFFFMYGKEVRGGSNDKVRILSGLVRVIGVATIITAIFTAISAWLDSGSIGTGIVSAIVSIIIGLILLWIALKISGKDRNVLSNVLWILLVVATLVLAILSLIGFFSVFMGSLYWILAGIQSLCWFFVYIYAFIASLSPEVKSSMGI